MADTLHDDQGKPSNDTVCRDERDSEPNPPQVTAEEVKQDAEAADRLEASDN